MTQFKVNAPAISLLNKEGKGVVIRKNETLNVEDFDPKDIVILATNSKPLILDVLSKRAGGKQIDLKDSEMLEIIKKSSGDYLSSITILDNGKLPAVPTESEVDKYVATSKRTVDIKKVENK